MYDIDYDKWELYRTVFEEVLMDGYVPFRQLGGKGSSCTEVAKRLTENHNRPTTAKMVNKWLVGQERRAANDMENYLPDWTLYAGPARFPSLTTLKLKTKIKRWILTAAQNETPVHLDFWNNLQAFSHHHDAEILVAPFTYNLATFTDHETRNNVFSEIVRPYLVFSQMNCGSVLFCAEMNTLPTATRPLSGLHTYTRGRTGIFPHAKIALESIPSMHGIYPPVIMTTGCCTVENYIQKKAGLKAAFHHIIGAVIVEQDDLGNTFCRHINATDDGSFQDLDVVVRDGVVTTGNRVEAVTWGDIHCRKLDKVAAMASFGFNTETWKTESNDSLLDFLRPRYQFFHDILDGESRNPYNEDNAHERFRLHINGKESLEEEVLDVAKFLRQTEREWSKSVVDESNHDLWLSKWLNKADYRKDPINALFFLKMQLAVYESQERGDDTFSVFKHALKNADPQRLHNIEFCPINGSFIICHDSGGIECGFHGHLGPNGSRATATSLIKIASKLNIGHSHSAGIYDGIYQSGVLGNLYMNYNDGPSSWTHSNIVTYPNGKRTIITLQSNKYRA
ncbi:MAG: hypothetical protein P4L79_10930 [Legionella sp.]|uniref:hypothetical protein n=1 Tax=Legionella sp. TaxID=459 RepID=UPI0028523856|nr:hypothetical protein [Legionella sp.]